MTRSPGEVCVWSWVWTRFTSPKGLISFIHFNSVHLFTMSCLQCYLFMFSLHWRCCTRAWICQTLLTDTVYFWLNSWLLFPKIKATKQKASVLPHNVTKPHAGWAPDQSTCLTSQLHFFKRHVMTKQWHFPHWWLSLWVIHVIERENLSHSWFYTFLIKRSLLRLFHSDYLLQSINTAPFHDLHL